jgi:hypothetical protein
MSSVDPMLLLAGKQPRKKTVRVQPREAPAPVLAAEEEEDDAAESSSADPPQVTPPPRHAQAVNTPRPAAVRATSVPLSMSLVDRCRTVIVAHLERYPAPVWGVLDPTEWATIIQRRHAKTRPTKGSGGLDGTGRLTPAVGERFMYEVENKNPHLANETTDRLVWKDCVNMRFRFTNELTRPSMLSEPWPLMVQHIQQASVGLLDTSADGAVQIDDGALARLEQAAMNVALLQATGIGKTVKKTIKSIKTQNGEDDKTGSLERLTSLLNGWKEMAARNGPDKDASDWKLAESSNSWLELHRALSQRETSRRSAQGQRMREIRANLNADRPKVVKVRPAKAQHTKILSASSVAHGSTSLLTPGNAKMQKIRKESSTLAHRQVTGRLPSVAWSTATTSNGNFARAVAVAACGKRKAGTSSAQRAPERRMRTAALPSSRPPPPSSARSPKKGIAKLRK